MCSQQQIPVSPAGQHRFVLQNGETENKRKWTFLAAKGVIFPLPDDILPAEVKRQEGV